MIVGLTGKSQHGKSAVGDILEGEHNFHQIAFATPMVNSATAVLGLDADVWDALKNDPSAIVTVTGPGISRSGSVPYAQITVREFFQRYGTEGHRDIPEFGEDIWRNMVDAKIADLIAQYGGEVNVVVTDVRMANEADLIRAYGGIVVEVYRPQTVDHVKNVGMQSHSTEAGCPCDFTLWNGGDFDDLRKAVRFDILGIGGGLRGVGETHKPAPARPLGCDPYD